MNNYKYMKNLIKDNLQVAMKFNGTMRYIDDLVDNLVFVVII